MHLYAGVFVFAGERTRPGDVGREPDSRRDAVRAFVEAHALEPRVAAEEFAQGGVRLEPPVEAVVVDETGVALGRFVAAEKRVVLRRVPVEAGHAPAADEHVVGDGRPERRRGEFRVFDAEHSRHVAVPAAPRRGGEALAVLRHLREEVALPSLRPHVLRHRAALSEVAARERLDAVHHDVPLDDGALSAARPDALRGAVDEVAPHSRAARPGVEVDAVHAAPRARLLSAHVDAVVLDHHAARRQVLVVAVDDAAVVVVLAHVVADVVADVVVVALELDADLVAVVDEVALGAAADADEPDSRAVGHVAPDVVDVVVLRHVVRGVKRLPPAAFEADAALAHVVDVAAVDAAARTAVEAHAPFARVPHYRADHLDVFGPLEHQGVLHRAREGEPVEDGVLQAIRRDEPPRLRRLDRGRAVGQPGVDAPPRAVNGPLAGAVQLGNGVEHVEVVALPEAPVLDIRVDADEPLLDVHVQHLLAGVGPVEIPAPVSPEVGLPRPARKARLVAELEDAVHVHLLVRTSNDHVGSVLPPHLRPAVVRPAGARKPAVGGIELYGRLHPVVLPFVREAADAVEPGYPPVARNVRALDLAPRRLRQKRIGRVGGVHLPPVQRNPSRKNGLCAGGGLPDDRETRAARILSAKLKRFRDWIDAVSKHHRRAGREPPRLAHRAQLVPRTRRRRERLRRRAVAGPVGARRRHMDGRRPRQAPGGGRLAPAGLHEDRVVAFAERHSLPDRRLHGIDGLRSDNFAVDRKSHVADVRERHHRDGFVGRYVPPLADEV